MRVVSSARILARAAQAARCDFGDTVKQNESVQWRLVGTTGPYLPGGSGVNPPAVTTYHNDNNRTGLNSRETTLTPSNVTVPVPPTSGTTVAPTSGPTFGKLFSYSVVGNVTAQPLFVPNVRINGALHNVIVAMTDQNNVYWFDAESYSVNGQPLLLKNLGPVAVAPNEFQGVGTPVVDATTNTVYVVTKTVPTATACPNPPSGVAAVAVLHALDLSSGFEKFNGPQCIAGSFPGTGEGSVASTQGSVASSTLNFDESNLSQRPALLLSNGYVYIGFESNGDVPQYHGWLFAYNASNLSLDPETFVDTPNATSVPCAEAGCPLPPGQSTGCFYDPVRAGAGI